MVGTDMKLTIGYLYPSILSQYGDFGNVLCLEQRCRWRGIDVDVRSLEQGAPVAQHEIDLFFMGGGADSQQRLISRDLLEVKGPAIREAIEGGAVALLICAGYQMFGRWYRPFRGEDLPGMGVFPSVTIHWAFEDKIPITDVPSAGLKRMVGNLVVDWNGQTLVGFENHGGRTYLDDGAKPLGRVKSGFGNNGKDGTEGAVVNNAYGTYLHGPLLPKNPAFADHLIAIALERRYDKISLAPLEDTAEKVAHEYALQLARRDVARK
ncbi:MAG: type 1 glutamine amidotransferase [Candidatus Dormibacterales bacterium]